MIETITLYNRRETVFLLNQHLGFAYDWHHILMLWTTKSKAGYSVLDCDIQLFPFGKSKKSPLYLPAEVAVFIKAMQARFPEMARPTVFVPSLYEVDTTPTPGFLKGIGYHFRKAAPALPVVAA